MSDDQVSTGQVDPHHAAEPPRSALKLLAIIAMLLAALVVFGALDH